MSGLSERPRDFDMPTSQTVQIESRSGARDSARSSADSTTSDAGSEVTHSPVNTSRPAMTYRLTTTHGEGPEPRRSSRTSAPSTTTRLGSRVLSRSTEERLRNRVTRLRQDQGQLEQKASKLQNQARQLQEEKEELEAILQDEQTSMDEVRQNANLQVKNAKDMGERYRKEYENVAKFCRDHESTIEGLNKQVNNLVAGALRTAEAAQWAPQSVERSEGELSALKIELEEWSKTYCTLTTEQVLSPSTFDRLAVLLRGKVCLRSERGRVRQLDSVLRSNKRLQYPGKMSELLLAAVVSSDVFHCVFNDAFFAFTAKDGSMIIGADAQRDALKDIYAKMLEIDEAGAHAWRCQTLRALDPMTNMDDPNVAKAKVQALKMRQGAALHLANTSISEYRDLFIKDSQDGEAFLELKKTILEATELSWKYWTRKFNIKVLDIDGLLNVVGVDENNKLKFKSSSRYMEVCAAHKLVVDDDPTALDGAEVVLVCSPAVVAYGTAEGTGYDRCQVWKKAKVLVG